MKKPMCISLRGGERIYVNGAVLRVDRKLTLELINDVAFLMESQVMQVADMLMSPQDVEEAKGVYREQRCALVAVSENPEMLRGLEAIEELVEARRYYDALRKIRTLFDIEQSILAGAELSRPVEVA